MPRTKTAHRKKGMVHDPEEAIMMGQMKKGKKKPAKKKAGKS